MTTKLPIPLINAISLLPTHDNDSRGVKSTQLKYPLSRMIAASPAPSSTNIPLPLQINDSL